ncbi:kinesin-like protein KIF21A [Clytia hemisphaerica]|uniref:kinesin-like protein KIF21A n=1 Tax=Clytia hemisphaerica TaxID=252671 RepID=UPI0034D69785
MIHSFYRDSNVEDNSNQDYVMNYQEALLTTNLLLRNIHDEIREGDGEQLMNSYKIVLLYFKATRHHKYGLAILNLLTTIENKPEKAFKLIWGRFVNTHGFRGRNISRDLHLEHLNRFLKGLLKPLHSSLNKENAKRIAFSIKNLQKIVKNFEDTLQIKEIRGSKRAKASAKDIKKLSLAYVADATFERKAGREYESFGKFNKRILSCLNDNFMTWVSRKRRELKENIYVFDDEEEEEIDEETDVESEESDSESDDSDSDSDELETDTSATRERLLSLVNNLQEQINKLKKT